MRNKKNYPENWDDTIRPAILARDKFKCSLCGVKHRAYVLVDECGNYTLIDRAEHEEYKTFGAKTYRIYLQVSHKNHDKSDCSDSNLWALCVRCHAKNDIAIKKLMRIAKPAEQPCGCGVPGCSIGNFPHESFNNGTLTIF